MVYNPEAFTILIVDDDLGVLELMQRCLKRQGFGTLGASSGREAIDLLDGKKVDLLLLDYFLPDMTGNQLLEELSVKDRSLPYIIISGRGDERLAADMVKGGAKDYIIKDTALGDILPSVVRRVLRQLEQHRKLALAEKKQVLLGQILERLNHSGDIRPILQDSIRLMKQATSYSAIAIRLKQDKDLLYYATEGFPEQFLELESHSHPGGTTDQTAGEDGSDENRICLCDLLLEEKIHPSLPFITSAGSFWTNNIKVLAPVITEHYGLPFAMNHCCQFGYESMALIPLRSDNMVIGLLQINDTRADQFNEEMIHFFEGIAASIGLALGKRQAEIRLRQAHNELEERIIQRTHQLEMSNRLLLKGIREREQVELTLRESEAKFRHIHDNSPVMMFSLNSDLLICDVNNKWLEETGYTGEEVLGKNMDVVLAPEFQQTMESRIQSMCLRDKIIRDLGCRFRKKNGELIDVLLDGVLTQDPAGKSIRLLVVRDITQQKRFQEQLLAYQKQLQMLASQLSFIEERERRQIAADLHDSIGQTMVLTQIKLESLRDDIRAETIASELNEIESLVEQTIKDVHSLTFELSPPMLHELGLEAAVEWLLENMGEHYGIRCSLHDYRQNPLPIPSDLRVVLFRAVRELLLNIVKHAKTDRAQVSIDQNENTLLVSVEDNGCGFDPADFHKRINKKGGFGLFHIRERLFYLGGQFQIDSEPSRGTRITMSIPLITEYSDKEAS